MKSIKKTEAPANNVADFLRSRDQLKDEIAALSKRQESIKEEIENAMPEYREEMVRQYNWVLEQYTNSETKRLVKAGDERLRQILNEERESVIRSRVKKETDLQLLESRIAQCGEEVSINHTVVRIATKKYDDSWFKKVEELSATMKLEARIEQVFSEFSSENPEIKASILGFRRQFYSWQAKKVKSGKK